MEDSEWKRRQRVELANEPIYLFASRQEVVSDETEARERVRARVAAQIDRSSPHWGQFLARGQPRVGLDHHRRMGRTLVIRRNTSVAHRAACGRSHSYERGGSNRTDRMR